MLHAGTKPSLTATVSNPASVASSRGATSKRALDTPAAARAPSSPPDWRLPKPKRTPDRVARGRARERKRGACRRAAPKATRRGRPETKRKPLASTLGLERKQVSFLKDRLLDVPL